MAEPSEAKRPARAKKKPKARALLIHACAYVAVMAVLAGLALWRHESHLWFLWVAAGWGIGLGAHGLGYWLSHEKSRARVLRDGPVRGLAIHAFVYGGVIALLIAVNFAGGKHHYWALWVAVGWGLGLAFHAWAVVKRRG